MDSFFHSLIAPSIQKSHRQPACPSLPFVPARIPAEIRPLRELEMKLAIPEMSAVRESEAVSAYTAW